MALEIQKGKSKWWYGRVMLAGRNVYKNLGVEIRGTIPATLREQGDMAFERSRAKAQAALEQLQLDMKKRNSAEELVQAIHEIRTGARVRSIPLGEAADRWAAVPRRRQPSPRYVAQARSWMARFVSFLNDHHPVVREMADVQAGMAQEFLKAEVARGVSPKTYNNTLIFLRSSFGMLRREAGLAENPFERLPTREEETIFRKPFNAEELAAIIDAAKSDPFIHPIIVTGICTAMRRGDCCQLRWESVDLPHQFIRVKTSKTGELVQIPIFPLLYDLLSKVERTKKPHVFPEQEMKYATNPDFITGRVRAVLRRAGFFDAEDGEENTSRGAVRQERAHGLRKASVRDFHSFRVSWVTLALSSGVPLEIVQKVTGHRTAAIVMKHYFQPGREEFRRTLAGKLPGLLGGRPEPKPIEPKELKAKLKEMTFETWESVRDELLHRLEPGELVELNAIT